MTTQEKNVAIAEMLGASTHIGYENKSSGYTEYVCEGEIISKLRDLSKMSRVTKILAQHLVFDSDANWQYEAIEWIEKQGYIINILGKPDRCTCIIRTLNPDDGICAAYHQLSRDKKSVIFETLFQFSQYLKEKK